MLAAIAALNFSVDPFTVYGGGAIPALRGYRSKLETRIARAEILEHHRCEVVIVGGSRAQIALDPERPYWGGPACNIGMTGAESAEIHAAVRHVLRQPEVREIVWTLDFPAFGQPVTRHPDFDHSRFSPSFSGFEYHAGMLLGSDALHGSLDVLRDYAAGRRSPFLERGRTDPAIHAAQQGYRERFLWSLERDAIAYGGPRPFEYDGGAAARTAELIAEVGRSGRALSLVILPVHALHLESLASAGFFEVFERWKRDLVEALAPPHGDGTPLWDCTGYEARLTEPVPAADDRESEMLWHWDSAHVKRELGDAAIAEIRAAGAGPRPAGAAEPLCTRLDGATLPGALARIREAQQRYRAASAAQLALIETARRRAGLPPAAVRTGSR